MDYIPKIREAAARSEKFGWHVEIATYIRAQACKNAAGLICYDNAQRLSIVEQGNLQASQIEQCFTQGHARRLLKEWGYL